MNVLLENGSFYTMDPSHPRCSAVAISGERIVAVGGDELRALAGDGTRVVDLEGRCAIPGLADSHIHFSQFALGLRRVNLARTTSLAEVLRLVAERAARTSRGEWILGYGWDQERWPDRRWPTAADLDTAAPEHPVALTAKSGHALVANSLALGLAGVTGATTDPAGGHIAHDTSGKPTGMLFDTAMRFVHEAIPQPSPEAIAGAMPEAFERAWSVGLTSVHELDGMDAFDAYERLRERGKLGLRVIKYVPAADLDHALALRLRAGFGDDWLRIGGVKIMGDGALGSRTAAMFAPYADEPENLGLLLVEPAELVETVRRATAGGLPTAIHAIGDRANRVVLDALEEGAKGEAKLRHRIEHVQLLAREDIGRLARLGIVASMQPIHATQDAEMAERYWGERCEYAYAWRSLVDAGTALAFGSDCPVENLNPFLGIHAATTRVSPSLGGRAWRPEQRLTVEEAVRAYTLGAAYAAGVEDRLGSITQGKLADLAVLDRDIFQVDPAEIGGTRVEMTVVGGGVVLDRLGA